MKTLLISTLLFSLLSCASQDQCTLEGRTFKIASYVDGKLDGTEMLTFKNNQADNDECRKYGFEPATYACSGTNQFKYTLTSPAEGKMDWEGTVTGEKIAGKMVWMKDGQNDIHYTFTGDEVK